MHEVISPAKRYLPRKTEFGKNGDKHFRAFRASVATD